ncbi:hypothetical protein MLD38_029702 [Melastoma candidum]|uniref:Uncharacterized protein n=1 Tax=Melastoma candidum TaxID=119954 RepID=A0ACB9N6J4_9MYRT|nr:hypothetical protein MLD38_029702 [Melastoma candidum]
MGIFYASDVQLKPLIDQLNRVKDLPIPEFCNLLAWEARASAAGCGMAGDGGANDALRSGGYSGTPMPFLGDTKVEVAFASLEGKEELLAAMNAANGVSNSPLHQVGTKSKREDDEAAEDVDREEAHVSGDDDDNDDVDWEEG